ncbi:MAG: gliding motility-associated ABC transporter permease subunit GldF [Lunatimonas sp.]|uniref:gliding motility-associated ABC transporter permease subunit GldF n=1 Tax=Lunatimonas sp. TaxID=2060141 RepID=UPI00263B4907|nr:gliding motility-associated ABC transporter permease subunit GldF [Lunatimonas sp.]MCC5939069.1 gliding motility-associated ABC transporter permease subunit GldF [Lunatimonas sp.]
MNSLFWREINAFFNNLSGYIVLVLFLVSIGLIVWVFPGTSVLEYGYADLESLFSYTPLVMVFLIPAITMRLVAEEKKSGTWEILLTTPLPSYQIVLAKYLASLVLILLALLPTLVYYYSVYQLGEPVGNIDSAAFFGSYIGLLLVSASFAAVGMFTSALTDNQIIAFVIGVFLSFLLYVGIASLASLGSGDWALFWEEVSLSYHYESMSRGVIVSQNVYYFLGLIISLLALTWGVVERR